jgi:hypothetical protein
MKQKYLVILLLTVTNQLFSQNKLLFADIKISDSMKLIGRYPHYDKDKTFEKYNFIIEDFKVLDSLTKTLKVGKPASRIFDNANFLIELVDGKHNIINSWTVLPNYSSIVGGGDFYEFDTNILVDLAKKYPLSYTFYEKEVKTEKAFSQFRDTLFKDNNFLFFYKSKLVFEGHFNLEFEKNKKFSSPKAISEYLAPTLDKLATKGKYNVIYELNDYNISHRNQYSMTISCSYEVYEAFIDKNAKKKEWQVDVNNATIFMRK